MGRLPRAGRRTGGAAKLELGHRGPGRARLTELSVALALVGRPRFVLLDEPTTGLDVDARHELWRTLREVHAAGTTVLLTSHYLEEVEALAERVVVLHQGRVLADDSLSGVLARVGVDLLSLRWTGRGGAARTQLASLPGLVHHEVAGDREVLYVRDADAAVRALVRGELPFADLRVQGASLEEAFHVLTAGSDVADAAPPTDAEPQVIHA